MAARSEDNAKATEFLGRRVDVADVCAAIGAAVQRMATGSVTWALLIVSATTPFERQDAALVGTDVAAALDKRVPQ